MIEIILIIILGLLTSYTDIKQRKIKNLHILIFLIAGIIINFSTKLFINITIAFIISFILYRLKVWGAGDGKLLVAYSSLISFPLIPSIPYFPSLILYINVFVFSSVVLLITFLPKLKKKHFNKDMLTQILSIAVFALAFKYLFSNLPYSILFALAFSFILNKLLSKFKIKYIWIVYAVILLLAFEPAILGLLLFGFLISLTKIIKKTKYPLAPLIFMSVILTLILKTEIITYLFNL